MCYSKRVCCQKTYDAHLKDPVYATARDNSSIIPLRPMDASPTFPPTRPRNQEVIATTLNDAYAYVTLAGANEARNTSGGVLSTL